MQNFHLFLVTAYLLLVDLMYVMNNNQSDSIQIECELKCILLCFKHSAVDAKDIHNQSVNHSILELIALKHHRHEQRFHDFNKQSKNSLMLSRKD